jgi:hypothetical protein
VPSVAQALSRAVLRSLMGLAALREVRAARPSVLGRLLAATGLLGNAIRPTGGMAVEDVLAKCGPSAHAGLIPLHHRKAGAPRLGPVCLCDERWQGRRTYGNQGLPQQLSEV